MLEVHVDALYVWVGLIAVAAAFFGVATSLPTAPPPDATVAADAVDTVAGSGNGSTAEQAVSASTAKLTPHGVGLRGDGRVSHARLVYGPVTPVASDDRLRAVLNGEPASDVFDSPADLAEAANRARRPPHRWQPVDRVRARTIVWGDVRVTLVGV